MDAFKYSLMCQMILDENTEISLEDFTSFCGYFYKQLSVIPPRGFPLIPKKLFQRVLKSKLRRSRETQEFMQVMFTSQW